MTVHDPPSQPERESKPSRQIMASIPAAIAPIRDRPNEPAPADPVDRGERLRSSLDYLAGTARRMAEALPHDPERPDLASTLHAFAQAFDTAQHQLERQPVNHSTRDKPLTPARQPNGPPSANSEPFPSP